MADELLDVWVQGRFAGVLMQRDSDVGFEYDDSYRTERYTPALSVSMPKRLARHGDVARKWIDNLLPDSDSVRDRWAASFGERRPTAFNLLRHMGQDCAGAVQILPSGTVPDDTGAGEPVSDSDIEQRLRRLRRDDAAWIFGDHGGRWSLGGAQGKFALARRPDGRWEEPTGRNASTHIFKVGIHRFEHGDLAEFVTMRMAALLGLSAARSEVLRFGDETAMVSERYDRRVDAASGLVTRVHQEDLCQALGEPRSARYESNGGPGIEAIAHLLATAIDPRDLADARRTFAAALIFNWLVAGTDAHAKNYSLLHFGSRVRMAPLYDLTSAALLLPPDEVRFKARSAMRIGGHYRLGEIGERHLRRAVATVGLGPAWASETADRLATALPGAAEQALDELGDIVDRRTRLSFTTGLSNRVADARRAFGRTPPDDQPPPGDHPPSGDPVWVAPHSRRGQRVDGYWRARPGRR